MIIGIDGNEANLENRVGVNQYAAELLCALKKLPEAQVHEWLIYLQSRPLPHLPKARQGWKYVITDCGMLGKIKAAWSTKPNVYFAPTHYLPPLLPCKSVMSVMDLGYLNFPKQFRKRDFIQLKYWTTASLRWSNAVLAISQSTRDEIIKNYPWAKNKITVTYLGYDKEKYKYTKVKKQEHILYVGTLKPSKNVEGLVEAYARLNTNLKLVIAGKKGWLYNSIFEKVKNLGITDRVEFLGFVDERKKLELLTRAKVFVSPSFTEGFGIPALEAMAVGTPVVVSNIGSYPEVVGKAGVMVDPYDVQSITDGINKVVSASTLQYTEMVKQGLLQAAKFSWEKTAKETLELLENVSR